MGITGLYIVSMLAVAVVASRITGEQRMKKSSSTTLHHAPISQLISVNYYLLALAF